MAHFDVPSGHVPLAAKPATLWLANFQQHSVPMMNIDHEHLTYFSQGRRFRLTDAHGNVVEDLIA